MLRVCVRTCRRGGRGGEGGNSRRVQAVRRTTLSPRRNAGGGSVGACRVGSGSSKGPPHRGIPHGQHISRRCQRPRNARSENCAACLQLRGKPRCGGCQPGSGAPEAQECPVHVPPRPKAKPCVNKRNAICKNARQEVDPVKVVFPSLPAVPWEKPPLATQLT